MREKIEKVISELEERRVDASVMVRLNRLNSYPHVEGIGRLAELNHAIGMLKEVLNDPNTPD